METTELTGEEKMVFDAIVKNALNAMGGSTLTPDVKNIEDCCTESTYFDGRDVEEWCGLKRREARMLIEDLECKELVENGEAGDGCFFMTDEGFELAAMMEADRKEVEPRSLVEIKTEINAGTEKLAELYKYSAELLQDFIHNAKRDKLDSMGGDGGRISDEIDSVHDEGRRLRTKLERLQIEYSSSEQTGR